MSTFELTESLTFDDVLLVPCYSRITPAQVDLSSHLTASIGLNIPVISAAMDTVTEAKLAITLAQEGGVGIIHKNMPIDEQAKQVREVKKYESGVIKNPITVSPDTSIREVIELTRKNKISGVPVVHGDNLVGIVTHRDLRFESRLDEPVSTVMTGKDKLITVPESAEKSEVKKLLHKHRIEKMLVVNEDFNLCGLITVKDFEKSSEYPDACRDSHGRLRVGAAIGVGEDAQRRSQALVEAEVDIIVVDTAHGHSLLVLETVSNLRSQYPQLQIIAGNIATAEAAKALADSGANAVKVGIGPGSICTTRMVSGVGVPQITAIYNVSRALADSPVKVVADGGIRFSGDIAKALAAGADSVMLGSLFAGSDEAPGQIELYQGRAYKTYRGMGSLSAMQKGSAERYFQMLGHSPSSQASLSGKLVPEGIEGRVPHRGSLVDVSFQLMGGLRSSMGYVGCKNIAALQNESRFIRITAAAMRESHVHSVSIVKESPNYQVDY